MNWISTRVLVALSPCAEAAPSRSILQKLPSVCDFNLKRRIWIVQEIEAKLCTCLATIEAACANHFLIDCFSKVGTRTRKENVNP